MSSAIRSSSLHILRTVQQVVHGSLAPLGFNYDVARARWLRSLPSGIDHTVALPSDVTSTNGPVVVTANLGVHCRPLAERLSSQGHRADHHLSTFTRNVGQLTVRRAWREWTIRDEADAERVAARVADAIVAVGIPWLGRFDQLETLPEGFRAFGHHDHVRCALPQLERMLRIDAPNDEDVDGQPNPGIDNASAADWNEIILPFAHDVGRSTWQCDD